MLTLDLKYFKELVQKKAGLTFDSTREEILRRQVVEMMEQRGYGSRAELYSVLQNDASIFLEFVNHLTINETYFFREPQYLQLLVGHLLPALLAVKKKGEKIRIISAGCSSGEEPYSIAMALLEKFGEDAGNIFAIVGVDINSLALEKADDGIYGKLSFRGSDDLLREKYFEVTRLGNYRIRSAVKDMVQFGRFNLLSDDYHKVLRNADVVFYRHVSIYFDSLTQRKILNSLAEIVNEYGYVVFSASETFSHQDVSALSLQENQGLFYYQKGCGAEDNSAAVGVCEDLFNGTHGRSRQGTAGLERCGKRNTLKGAAAAGGLCAEKVKVARGGLGRWGSADEPAAAEELFQDALVCFRKKEHGRALQLAERLQACECHRANAYLLGGCVYLHRKKDREAVALFDKALQIDSLNLEAHLLLGLTAKNSGEIENAIKSFNKALYVHNSCWVAHYFLAEIYHATGNCKKAVGYYATLLKILEGASGENSGLTFFPISFKREDLLHLCRKKISLMSGMNHGV